MWTRRVVLSIHATARHQAHRCTRVQSAKQSAKQSARYKMDIQHIQDAHGCNVQSTSVVTKCKVQVQLASHNPQLSRESRHNPQLSRESAQVSCESVISSLNYHVRPLNYHPSHHTPQLSPIHLTVKVREREAEQGCRARDMQVRGHHRYICTPAEQETCKRGDTRRDTTRTFSSTNAMSDFSLRSAFVCGMVCEAWCVRHQDYLMPTSSNHPRQHYVMPTHAPSTHPDPTTPFLENHQRSL